MISSTDARVLRGALQDIFSIMKEKYPDVSFEFLSGADFEPREGYTPVEAAKIHVTGEGYAPLHIEENIDGFRISILSGSDETFAECSHVLHVPRGSLRRLEDWVIDKDAAFKNPRLCEMLALANESEDPAEGRRRAIGAFFQTPIERMMSLDAIDAIHNNFDEAQRYRLCAKETSMACTPP